MKKRIISALIIFALSCIMVGCFGEKEATKSKNSEKDKPPNELKELQNEIDEVVKNTMKKDWTASLTKTKDIQTTWNELYPDLQEKGIAQESVDGFVDDLNTLSNSLIDMTLKLPKEKQQQGGNQEQGSQQQTTQQGGGQGEGGQGGGGTNQEQSQKASSQPSNQSGGGQSEQQGGGEQGGQGGSQQQDQINKDPQKALEKVDPTVDLNKEELSIVRNSIELQKHMNKFVSLFNVQAPGDLYQLKYLLHDINISSKEINWEKVNSSMKSTLNLWGSIEPKALEADKNLNLQLKQSINEVEDVVREKNEKLIGMKTKTSLELIEKLIKSFEEK
ncbi:hypothetical protein DES36_101229 [Alkalibaculum bacchi]|uniref:Lipoprotein n=1 Tax=Alkalibaculum bacchi TaxID=645887 RepID=A0A366IFL5_9FIRM|nr:hypothetical protein [Alkalibaculum bacchi]RBP70172.1 hypothetical protein DES36_101229 [Alkalibaculum bacchi]